jgi:hypothetical protein
MMGALPSGEGKKPDLTQVDRYFRTTIYYVKQNLIKKFTADKTVKKTRTGFREVN